MCFRISRGLAEKFEILLALGLALLFQPLLVGDRLLLNIFNVHGATTLLIELQGIC